MNTIGRMVALTTFGESHGPAMGGVLDGLPSLVYVDIEEVQAFVDRRRPGVNPLTSTRKENDRVEILSGITPDGLTLGSPIGFIVRNSDARSADYDGYKGKFRPNHADYTYSSKYGIHDFRGGGRASARETVSRVIGGALCAQWLKKLGIDIHAEFIETLSVEEARNSGDSVGGIVKCEISGMPVGIGEPVFDKLHSRLAGAMMSINAAKAFEYGDGFAAASMTGSESMDHFLRDADGTIRCDSNHSGGIQGGISNGMPIVFKVYFKPTPTIMRQVETIDSEGGPCAIDPRGRHDPCVAVRAVPVVEAMAWLTVADMMKQAGFGRP